MITVFTVNGKITLTLGPSTELEKTMLLELCKGPVEIQSHSTLQIGDKQIPDAVTITPIQALKGELMPILYMETSISHLRICIYVQSTLKQQLLIYIER